MSVSSERSAAYNSDFFMVSWIGEETERQNITLRMYKRGQQFEERATYSSRDKMKLFPEQGA